jgi:SAM-dependent methyltransferase
MWHVLEHVPNINKTISNINRILQKDGIAIIAVPNHKSWDTKYYQEFWAAWDVPIHLWHFSKETIEKIFQKHDLKLIKTKPMIFDSFYVSLLSEEFKTGKKNFISGFLIGLISNIIGIISKRGHSSTIYIFKKTD